MMKRLVYWHLVKYILTHTNKDDDQMSRSTFDPELEFLRRYHFGLPSSETSSAPLRSSDVSYTIQCIWTN